MSNRSRRMEKQKMHGMGSPEGFKRTQCADTDCVVFSNAWEANFSQYSTTDWFSKSYDDTLISLQKGDSEAISHLIDVLRASQQSISFPLR